jgi:nucleotide-binding universal stress UspA family protein
MKVLNGKRAKAGGESWWRPRTILVPTDYSPLSRLAFDLACQLAHHDAARLTLLHVAELPPLPSLGMAAAPPLSRGYLGAWESQLSLIRPRDPAVEVAYRVEEGPPAAAILRTAEQTATDLIVMAARRASLWLPRRGVTGRVLRRARCPVLALTPPRPPPETWQQTIDSFRREDMLEFRTILHPTDFSERSMYAFGLARDLARGSGCELLIIHVAPARLHHKRSHRREMDEALRRLTESDPGPRMQGLLLAGDPASEIVCTATQVGCDLIVMGTSGRTGLRRLLTGSVARAVQKCAPCPVLTVHLPTREGGEVLDFAVEEAAASGRATSPFKDRRFATNGRQER